MILLSAARRHLLSLLPMASKSFLSALKKKEPHQQDEENQIILELQKPISMRILKLEDFIKLKVKECPKYLLENEPQKVFIFGTEPIRLRHELYVYFKYGFWHHLKIGEERLLAFIDEIETKEKESLQILKEDPSSWSAHQNIDLVKSYRKHLAGSLLPKAISKMTICEKYIQILITFLQESDHLDEITISYIFSNIENILYSQNNDRQFINERDYGWMMITAFDLFVQKVNFKELSWRHKSFMIMMGKSLRSNNLSLLEFVKKELQTEKNEINYHDFLAGLNLLSINKSFPYEFFYKNKELLLQLVESAQNLSQKKVKNSQAMLQIFARERLMFCEKIVDRLLLILQQNLVASDTRQLIRTFYYYSKLKSSIKHDFVIKIVERIYLFMDIITEREYSLIIKSLANLNYQDRDLVQKLKAFNYELFLTNLKYGCEKLGSFYKTILDQIQNSYKQDSLRYSRLDDQMIHEVVTQVEGVETKAALAV